MREQTKRAAVVGTGGTLAFLGYQCMELAKQNYDLVQRIVKLEERQTLRFGDVTPEEASMLLELRKQKR